MLISDHHTIKIYGNFDNMKTITFVLVAKQSTSLTLNSSILLFANCWMFKVIEFSFWHIFSFKAAMSVVLLMQQQLYILMRHANARTLWQGSFATSAKRAIGIWLKKIQMAVKVSKPWLAYTLFWWLYSSQLLQGRRLIWSRLVLKRPQEALTSKMHY